MCIDVHVIATDQLIWHEMTDAAKLRRIVDVDGCGEVFKPIQVMAHGDDFVILNGAHRARAAQLNGRHSIAATVHRVPGHVRVPGWTHVVSRAIAQHLLREFAYRRWGAQASLIIDGQRHELGLPHVDDFTAHRIFHDVARIAYREGQHTVRATTPVDSSAALLTWHPPRLERLLRSVAEFGPMPATFTRFAPVLAAHGSRILPTHVPIDRVASTTQHAVIDSTSRVDMTDVITVS